MLYRGAEKSVARPTSPSIVFSVHGTGGSPTGPDPENRLVFKTLEAQVGQFLLGFKWPVSRFLPCRAKDLTAPMYKHSNDGDNSFFSTILLP
jgi:hypothetical protein